MTFHNQLYRQERNPQRHRLIRAEPRLASTQSTRTFETIESLREALQFAVSLEHFTIPPYLCALYSIHAGANVGAAQIIRSVAVEEMLHMMLAANILNAIGGKPVIGGNELFTYPHQMPKIATRFDVNLLRFSKDAVNTFLRIERPARQTLRLNRSIFGSIGEFYQSVREALRLLDAKKNIFTGKQQQVTNDYYGSGGKLFAVCNIKDAEDALDEIVGQGEGIDGSIEDGDGASFGVGIEYAHYFRFNEIFHERRYRPRDKIGDAPSGEALWVDWSAVYNMVPNPKMSMFVGRPALLAKVKEFNHRYTQLLKNLDIACNGKPDVLKEGVPMMHALRMAAVDLMQEPSGIGNYSAGPSFELVR